MGNIVDRLAAPCDSTFLAHPMPCGDDDEELGDMIPSERMGTEPETEEERIERMNRVRERAPPLYTKKHEVCSTNDEDAGFTLVAFQLFRPLATLLSIYSLIFTLKTWSYLTFVQYYLADPKAGRITNADGVIYVAALVVGWLSLLAIIIIVTVVNMLWKESEPALADHEAKGQYLGSGIDGLLRMFHTRNTSLQLSVEDIEKTYVDRQTAAQHAKEKLAYWALQASTNPYFRLNREEDWEKRQLEALVYDYDHGDFRITPRRTRMLQAVTAVLWASDIWMFVVDANVFVNATWLPLAGGVNAFLGLSLIIGVASAIFPPWLLYQKYMLRFIKSQLL